MTFFSGSYVWVFEIVPSIAARSTRHTLAASEEEAIDMAAGLIENSDVRRFRVVRVPINNRFKKYHQMKPG